MVANSSVSIPSGTLTARKTRSPPPPTQEWVVAGKRLEGPRIGPAFSRPSTVSFQLGWTASWVNTVVSSRECPK